MRRTLSFALVLALVVLAAPVSAEHHEEAPNETIIWVSFLKAPPGGSQNLIELVKKQDAPLWTQLLADGKILEWGIAQPITHRGDDPYTIGEWATFTSWAAVDDFVAGFMAKQASMSDEERATDMEAYMSAIIPGSHYDAVHDGIYAATDGGRPAYLLIGFHRAKASQEEAATKMWMKFAKPVYEKLMANGELKGFGLFGQALHGDHRWTHGSWATMSGLAGKASIDAAFEAAAKSRSEEENKEMMSGFQKIFEPNAHWDELLAVVHYDNGSGQ